MPSSNIPIKMNYLGKRLLIKEMFANFAANNFIFITMKKYVFACLLLWVAGLQTIQAQSMIIKTSDGRTIPFGIEEVDSVFFTDAKYVGGHEYIDLGLPSGTLWASCNVGADTPEEFGSYFAWGETMVPPLTDKYGWDTYSLCEGSMRTITRYNDNDHMTWLKPADDAATCNWGSVWQMPSKEQFEELINPEYTLFVFAEQNGVAGLKVTSKINGNSIFLPAAGQYAFNGYVDAGSNGYYWSRTLYSKQDWNAHLLLIQQGNYISTYGSRYCCNSIRPVLYQDVAVAYVSEITLNETSLDLCPGETFQLSATVSPDDAVNREVSWVSSEPNVASVSEDGIVTAKNVSNMSCTITCYANDGSGAKAECQVTVCSYVDLGLPSGTLWAKYNLGANLPEELGDYYAWGETKPKESYSVSTYKYCNGSENALTKYCYDASYGDNGYWDGVTELSIYDDAATMNWGGNWVTPSYLQLVELIDDNYTTQTWTTRNGVSGCLIKSKSNGKSIFLPANGFYGWYSGNSLQYLSYRCNYWSSSLAISSPRAAQSYWLDENGANVSYTSRYFGMGIRPVRVMQNPPVPAVRRIIVSESKLKFDLGEGTTTTLTATILPSNANKAISWSSSDTNVATVNKYGKVTPTGVGTCSIICTADDGSGVTGECQVTVVRLSGTFNGHEWVDLGLPSGTLWATCNVGSSTPEGEGTRYAWGEVSPKSEYKDSNYKWGTAGQGYSKYTMSSGDGLSELLPEDDAATYNWGSNWQTPSESQLQELMYEAHYGYHTSKYWTTVNGVDGFLITGKSTGKSIFLPATDPTYGQEYWARDLNEVSRGSLLWIRHRISDYEDFGFFYGYRYAGEYIRPVVKK